MNFSLIFLVSFTKAHPWEEVWLFAWPLFMLFTWTHSFRILVCERGSLQDMSRSGWWSCISGGWKSKAENMKGWFSLSAEGSGLSLCAFGSSWLVSWASASCWVVRYLHPDLARKGSTSLVTGSYLFKVIEAGLTEQKLTTLQSLGTWKLRHVLAPL